MLENQQEKLERIKKTHENIALTLGTILAITLVVYFFSYSGLADSKYANFIWFEAVSSLLIIWALIKIQALALFFTKLRFKCKTEYRDIVQNLALDDLRR